MMQLLFSWTNGRSSGTLLSTVRMEEQGTMTVLLNLKPEVEAGLLARAQASGMSLQEYVLSVVEDAASPSNGTSGPAGTPGREQAVRRMLEFGEKHHLSLGEPITRRLLHEGHRFRF